MKLIILKGIWVRPIWLFYRRAAKTRIRKVGPKHFLGGPQRLCVSAVEKSVECHKL